MNNIDYLRPLKTKSSIAFTKSQKQNKNMKYIIMITKIYIYIFDPKVPSATLTLLFMT